MRIPFVSIIERLVRPRVEVAGFFIGATAIICTTTNQDKKIARTYSIPLSAPIIRDGGVVDADVLITAIRSLRSAMGIGANKDIPIILSISDEYVYTQTLSLPSLKGESLNEAIVLNMEMISPLKQEERYEGWQRVSSQSGQETILASFVGKAIIDSLIDIFARENVSIVAIEQMAASVARFLSSCDQQYVDQDPYFVLYVGDAGISFSIIRAGVLEFNRFSSWSDVGAVSGQANRSISSADFSAMIIRESSRILNYYSGKSGVMLTDVYVLAPGMEDSIRAIFDHTQSLRVRVPQLRCYQDQGGWPVSLGAALRGDIPRASDQQISLAPESTREHFAHAQVVSFISLWRNVFAVVFTVILLACVSVFVFLSSFADTVTRDLTTMTGAHNVAALEQLKNEAKQFNEAVAIALSARQQQNRWADIVAGVYAASGDILIDRLYVQSPSDPVTINARATSEQAAIAFKGRIEQVTGIVQADLPLSSVTPAQGGQIAFQLSFRVRR